MRYRDPRRFGCWLWTDADPSHHRLLAHLGPEPLEPAFDGGWLYARLRGRTAPIKNLLMDSRIVAGVGNIYANEALFIAGIDPRRAGGRICAPAYRSTGVRAQARAERGGRGRRHDPARLRRDRWRGGGIRQSAQCIRTPRCTLSALRRPDRQDRSSDSERRGSVADASGDRNERGSRRLAGQAQILREELIVGLHPDRDPSGCTRRGTPARTGVHRECPTHSVQRDGSMT